jgi:hypothetical protein
MGRVERPGAYLRTAVVNLEIISELIEVAETTEPHRRNR